MAGWIDAIRRMARKLLKGGPETGPAAVHARKSVFDIPEQIEPPILRFSESLERLIAENPDKFSERKLRLFACAHVRHCVWHLLEELSLRQAVEVAERLADGQCEEQERQTAEAAARIPSDRLRAGSWELWEHRLAASKAHATLGDAREAARMCLVALEEKKALNLVLFRDVFGHMLHRTSVDPAWLAWNLGTVPRLARGIYEGEHWSELPILADALEEAGCDDQAILTHLRATAPAHTRAAAGRWICS